jgi:hypothetical protein
MEKNAILAIFLMLPCLIGIMAYQFFGWLRRGGRRHPGWLYLMAGNLLILLLLCSMLLLAGEVYYRFFNEATDAFGLARGTKEWFVRHYHFNQLGFRDSIEFTFERLPGRRRITVVGDSFTAGHGIRDVEDRFANRIRSMRPDWDVQVMASNGFDTGAELQLIQNLRASRYGFDQLVLVYCLNDIADIVPEWQAIQQRLYNSPGPGFLLEHSYLLNTIYYRVKSTRDPDISRYYHFVVDAYDGPLWEKQQQRLAAFEQTVTSAGGRLLVVTFPFLHELGASSSCRPAHRRLADFWHHLGTPHLDLLGLFAAHEAEDLMVSNRDPHPSERAHELAAEAVLAFVEAEVRESDLK